MGSSNPYKKRHEGRKQRRYEFKNPRANSFLIVTEGKCTEPNYFRAIKEIIEAHIGGTIDIVDTTKIDIYGEGFTTGKLLKITEEKVRKAKVEYQNIWIVFDNDDSQDFDAAIQEGLNRGYHIAWSNQCFEYWLYLHFHYSEASLTSSDWVKKLNGIFEQQQIGDGKYHKNSKNIYDLVNQAGSVKNAIKNAGKRMSEFGYSRCKPSEYNPGTEVHILVKELLTYLDE